ncbi:amino acid ABC transporter permease [Synergistales bacterium]|nr:amino acid ABC transporter permease [Synergistales bacterium]
MRINRISEIKLLFSIGTLIVLALVPLIVVQPYIQHVFILTFYMATTSMAWSILGGMTGQNSMGHAAFMGMGAYFSSMMVVRGMTPWMALPISVLCTGLIAVAIFYPCFILRGPYFTLVTIALGEAFRNFLLNWDLAGKAMGILLPFGDDSWLDFRFFSKLPYYYVSLIMTLLVYLLVRKIDRSKLGFALKTIREDEDVAAAIGIYSMKYKLIAVWISTMIMAASGFFYAQYLRYIDPTLVLQTYSVEFVLPAIIGGIRFVNGPIFGAFILVPLSEYLRAQFSTFLPGVNLLVYAMILILMIRFLPTGLLGWYSTSSIRVKVDRILAFGINQSNSDKKGSEVDE